MTGKEKRELNLIPFNKRTPKEHQEISAKGGRATKGLPKYSLTKCKNCRLPCPNRDEGTKEGWKCKVPDAKRMILEAALYPEKLTETLFGDAFSLQTTADTFDKKLKAFYAKLNLKKETYPAVQKSMSITANIDIKTTEERFESFMKKKEEWNHQQKESGQ